MKIPTKQQFINLYIAGVLGNRFRVWTDLESCLKDDPDEVGLRELAVGAGSFEMCSRGNIEATALKWIQLQRKFYLNESDKDHLSHLAIQGEICRTSSGYHGYIGDAHGLRMRDMFKAGYARNFGSIETRHIMRSYMDENSLSDVDDLLDLYPDATIEFACYRKTIGVLPNRNTIIWEVRDY